MLLSCLKSGMLPVGILASVTTTVADNPWLTQIGEKVGVVCIMGYFLWDKTRECKQIKEDNKNLMERLIEREKEEHE